MSAMIRHIPARTGAIGRKAHRQWLMTKRQPAQRSALEPPRAKNGLELRARRAVRRRLTAWGVAVTSILQNVSAKHDTDLLPETHKRILFSTHL